MTFFDDGNTQISTSTWPQVGRAVARLLSLKVLPDDANDTSPYLSKYNNRVVYASSFLVSQRDMLDSVLRVTGAKESDWTITHEDAVKRFDRGRELLSKGNMVGFVMLLYTRVFYQNGGGDFSDKLDNDLLGLPKENLDDATAIAVNMALSSKG